ncbi:hypothetical protein B0H11DRAFT_2274967 [Mycena galericulata]|nr:hypothetical protein B0H11DRAFT_2274967 [Mycena galericulata]
MDPLTPSAELLTSGHDSSTETLSAASSADSGSVIWANRVLVSAAVIYLYDYVLTFSSEVELYQHSGRDRKLFWSFLALRYLPALYQLLMVASMVGGEPTLSRYLCSVLDKISLGLDTSFQLSYIGIISWRVKVIMLELEEKGRDRRRSGRSSRAVLPTTQTLVGSEPVPDSAPAPPLTENSDSGSSLHTFETRSIGWNRVGLCLGAKAF